MDGDNAYLSDAELAELAAFADGSLPSTRREAVAARVEASPELRALVAEQRAALDAVRAIDAPAPARLRADLQTEHTRRGPQPRWRGFALAGRLVAAFAAAALVAVLVAGSGESGPSIPEVAELAHRGPAAPAPPPDPARATLLAASVEGVPFPAYAAKLGWGASGARSDRLDGRAAETVFYDRGGRRVAYTIVAGEALEWPDGARVTVREEVELRVLERDGATIVTWLREGRTCVLSGTGVPRDELLELAAWNGEGTVPF